MGKTMRLLLAALLLMCAVGCGGDQTDRVVLVETDASPAGRFSAAYSYELGEAVELCFVVETWEAGVLTQTTELTRRAAADRGTIDLSLDTTRDEGVVWTIDGTAAMVALGWTHQGGQLWSFRGTDREEALSRDGGDVLGCVAFQDEAGAALPTFDSTRIQEDRTFLQAYDHAQVLRIDRT